MKTKGDKERGRLRTSIRASAAWEKATDDECDDLIETVENKAELDAILRYTPDQWQTIQTLLAKQEKAARLKALKNKEAMLETLAQPKPRVAIPDYEVKEHAAPTPGLANLLAKSRASLGPPSAGSGLIRLRSEVGEALLSLDGQWEMYRQRPDRYRKGGLEPPPDDKEFWTDEKRRLEEEIEKLLAEAVGHQRADREEDAKRADWKRNVDTHWTPAKGTFNRLNPGALASKVFNVAYDTAVGKTTNSTITQHTDAEILAAVTTWLAFRGTQDTKSKFTGIHVPVGEVNDQQRVLYIQDKSKRRENPDPQRNRQADFILTWDGYEKNVHVDANPATRPDEVKWEPPA